VRGCSRSPGFTTRRSNTVVARGRCAGPTRGWERQALALGKLERKVMDVLWDADGCPLSGREVADRVPDRAYTTVLTILERLRRKRLVERADDGGVNTFRATGSRESHTASLMLEQLGSAPDRDAVLVRFAQTVSDGEAKVLRRALDASQKRSQ
jgi:predicted transcriptional regulator